MAVLNACEIIKQRLDNFHAGLEAGELKTNLDNLRDSVQSAEVVYEEYFKAVVNAVRCRFAQRQCCSICIPI